MVKVTIVAAGSPKYVAREGRPPIRLDPGQATEVVVDDDDDDDEPPVFWPTIELPTFEKLTATGHEDPRIDEAALAKVRPRAPLAVDVQLGARFDVRQLRTLAAQTRHHAGDVFLVARG